MGLGALAAILIGIVTAVAIANRDDQDAQDSQSAAITAPQSGQSAGRTDNGSNGADSGSAADSATEGGTSSEQASGSNNGSGQAGAGSSGSQSSCQDVVFTDGANDGAFSIRQTGADCETARRVATEAGRQMGSRSFPGTISAAGYTCTAVPIDTRQGLAARVDCKNGGATAQFERRFS